MLNLPIHTKFFLLWEQAKSGCMPLSGEDLAVMMDSVYV
jgi:hypothetical protein